MCFQLTSQIWNNCWGIISFCLNYNAIKLAWSLWYQSDLSVGIRTINSSIFLFFRTIHQKVVHRGMPRWADTGDDAEGRRGPHSTPDRAHHTTDQGFSGCLRTSLHPWTQSPQLRVQRGAQTEAPHQAKKHVNGHIYGHANWHTTKS